MIKKYKKGDEVIVTSGKDKGKVGKIAKVIVSADKVLIPGINVAKKHEKPSQDSKGGIVNKDMPIHISNILA
ncbi:50S ribosomal protein L24, partial [Alphaproteobacteria bacterium]|nr:50S ribosomal protein L24 [Alphaproteobacteria bacterium]